MQIINNTLQFYHPMIWRLFFMGMLAVYVMGSSTEIVIIIEFLLLLREKLIAQWTFISANKFFGYSFNTMTSRNKRQLCCRLNNKFSRARPTGGEYNVWSFLKGNNVQINFHFIYRSFFTPSRWHYYGESPMMNVFFFSKSRLNLFVAFEEIAFLLWNHNF